MIYEHLHKMIRNSEEELQATEQGARSRIWSVTTNPRIVRVPRSFCGKDRHSKVSTVRGLRDRRVRLSVATAIQVYNLQDKLGLDQPSKVVDWLINAAQHAIDKLPPLIQFPHSLRSSYEEGLILPSSYQTLPMMPIGEVQDQQVASKNSETVHQNSYDQCHGVSNMHGLSYLGSNSNQEEDLNHPYYCCQTLAPCSSMPCIFDTKQYNQVHMPFSVAEDLSLGQYNHHESSMPSI